jgi:hypothetical protein
MSGIGPFATGSFLWSDEALPDLAPARLSNEHLLRAVRAMSFMEAEGLRRPVDFKNVGARELGSIYESLLELHPDLDTVSGAFILQTASGNERKTTAAITHPPLINCLLDSALEPVIQQAMAKGDPEQAILDLKICDPASGSGHFLIAAATVWPNVWQAYAPVTKNPARMPCARPCAMSLAAVSMAWI